MSPDNFKKHTTEEKQNMEIILHKEYQDFKVTVTGASWVSPPFSPDQILTIKVDDHSARLSNYKGQPILAFLGQKKTLPIKDGRPIDALSISKEQEKAIRDFLSEHIAELTKQANQAEVTKIIITYYKRNGWQASSPKLKLSHLRTEFQIGEIFKKANKQNRTGLVALLNQYPNETDYGDYSITETWTLTYAQWQTVLSQVQCLAQEYDNRTAEIVDFQKEHKTKTWQGLSLEAVAREKWGHRLHVNEEGEFSDCHDDCDDCIWVDVWRNDAPQDVWQAGSRYTVTSKTGKVHTYSRITDTSMSIALGTSSYAKELEEFRQSVIKS